MAACNQIIGYLDELLDPTAYDDYGPNGLQVPGSEQIQTVVTGVSANAELFARAREEGADLVLVHHGLFWAGPPRALDRASKRRLQLLFDADLALAAYHLPLDGHLEVGNNALLAGPSAPARSSRSRPTGARPSASARASPTGHRAGRARGARACRHRARAAGLHRRPRPRAHDRHRLRRRRRPPRGRDRRGPRRLRHRRARRALDGARARGGVHFLAAGHYATETFGVRALGERLAERFGIRHVFVDVPNPI